MRVLEWVPEACGDEDNLRIQRRDPGWIRGIAAAVMAGLQKTVRGWTRLAQVHQIPLLNGQGIAHEPQFPVLPVDPYDGGHHVGIGQGEG